MTRPHAGTLVREHCQGEGAPVRTPMSGIATRERSDQVGLQPVSPTQVWTGTVVRAPDGVLDQL